MLGDYTNLDRATEGLPGCSRAGKWPKRPILCELGSNNDNSAIARTVFKDMFISMVGQ